jgi:TM2 domain-containing membrane protein YozV
MTPPKSKIAAGLLALFLGGLGIHRFYLGFNTIGITMLLLSTVGGLLTCGITSAAVSVWALVEAILIFCTNFQDADGRDLI